MTDDVLEIMAWFLKYGFVVSAGIEVDINIKLGDLEGIIDQMDAGFRGLT